jgi:molybdopterin synthase sulfur carrier subunit
MQLRFFANYRAEVGRKEIQRAYPDGSTVGDVLLALEAEFPGLEGDLLQDGAVREQTGVLKNGRDVHQLQGTATPMEDTDRLSVFPPVVGGCSDHTRPWRSQASASSRSAPTRPGDSRWSQ